MRRIVASVTIHLVRHAHARSRSDWEGADRDRPLSPKGWHQADELAARYHDRAVSVVLSSPAVRCQQTVAAIARGHGLEVEVRPALDEGSSARGALQLLCSMADADTDVVLCLSLIHI